MNLKAYRYNLELNRPLRLGKQTLTHREGVLLSPTDRPDCWGDAAPLPGLSRETIDDVIRSLLTESGSKPPSLEFALQSLDLKPAAVRVPVNALLSGTREVVLQRAAELHDLPYQSIKLKVGREPTVDQEIEFVQQVRQRLRPDQRLRLDANRRWSLEQAVRFGKGVQRLGIEYIEEPLKRPRECELFLERTEVPYALDETLVQSPRLEHFPRAAALVVKPTLLGNRRVFDRLQSAGIPLVFSSCFESALGLLAVARLAASYSPALPAGLDTSRWFVRDLLIPAPETDQGFLDLGVAARVDYSQLEEVF